MLSIVKFVTTRSCNFMTKQVLSLNNEIIKKYILITRHKTNQKCSVLLAFLSRDHPYSDPVPMGCRYLNVTHCSKIRF